MVKSFARLLLMMAAALILLVGCGKQEEVPRFVASASVDAAPEVLDSIDITLPEGMSREVVSDIQHDFILNGQQAGGIILLDVPQGLLDAPLEGLFDIVELLRQQLMPDVPPEEAGIVSFGGNQNAFMELGTGPDEIAYCHYLFRGENYTYDVWFNAELMEQDMEQMAQIVASVTGADILPENNQNQF